MAVGLTPVMTLLDPYGAFGRMASNLLGIPYIWGNNLLAHLARRVDSYAFYSVDVWLKSAGTLTTALLTLGIVSLLAWKNGRTYCNTICPVGTALGVVSRFSLFRPRIDRRKCAHCGLCEKGCKSSCIHAATGEIDHSRCVVCLNCMENCRLNAIRYSRKGDAGGQADGLMEDLDGNGRSRRNFLAVSTLLAVGAATRAQAKQFDGGLALIKDKEAPARTTSIVPPGARGLRNFSRHCTACQLCVSGCPNQVLRPSATMNGFMQPEMSFERGYCRPECTRCGQVCPTGAIHAVTAAEKSAIQIGQAVWNWDRCIVNRDRVSCNTCARHCPTGAIKMIPRQPDDPASPKFPMIDINRCTGCGACENLCPARPLSAIHVDGHEMHKTM
jgi:formate hydrogenlyase subunit 6/NADH:ubiquinone oxidoreductase subunit I